jgi:hypothetical protein
MSSFVGVLCCRTAHEYFQGLWGDRNTANFDEQRREVKLKVSVAVEKRREVK